MSEIKPKQCICGSYPKIEQTTNFYGGGRYKGKTRSDSWNAHCKGKDCHCQVYKNRGVFETKAKVIDAWNKNVTKHQARLDAPDKLIYDLENSDDDIKKALARILKTVEQIKCELALEKI